MREYDKHSVHKEMNDFLRYNLLPKDNLNQSNLLNGLIIRNLPEKIFKKKVSDLDIFTSEFHQTLKKEISVL